MIVVACSSPGKPPTTVTAARTLDVPPSAAPTLDGNVDAAEWARAKTVDLGSGVTLRLMHDDAKLYLAVSGLTTGTGFGCVMVADTDRVSIFHASAKLGSALYERTGSGTFRPRSKEYVWREPDAMLREEGWTATTVGGEQALQQEYAITYEQLGWPDKPRPIAFGYFVNPPNAQDLTAARVLAWPTDLDDAVTNVELVAGANPDDVRFEPARWMLLRR